jgi:heme oxygenase
MQSKRADSGGNDPKARSAARLIVGNRIDAGHGSAAHAAPGGQASAREILRRETDVAHRRLHADPWLSAVAEGRVDRPGFRVVLAHLFGFYRPLEDRLAASGFGAVTGIEFASHARAPFLRDDLRFLGLRADEIEALAACTALPEIDSPSAFLGCLYVLDGSRLGGSLLARALDSLFPADQIEGRSFFAAHRDRIGAIWRETCAAIEACGSDEQHLHEMVLSAREAFAALEAWQAVSPDREA